MPVWPDPRNAALRLSLLQFAPRMRAEQANVGTMARMLDSGADLALTPELSLTGYDLRDAVADIAHARLPDLGLPVPTLVGAIESASGKHLQIILADVSMSLDNVIAVAGAAEGHHWSLLAFGLLLSIALMALAANFIAKLLNRHRWIAYVGLAVILFVAVEMVLKGLGHPVKLGSGVAKAQELLMAK